MEGTEEEVSRILGFRQHLVDKLTPAETLLYNKLKDLFFRQQLNYRFNLIIRQAVIGWYIVDFLLPSKHLVIELDGLQHNRLENKADDIIRDNYLYGLGLDVVRWSNSEIFEDTDKILTYIDLWASLESPVSNFFKVKSAIKHQFELKEAGKLQRSVRHYDFWQGRPKTSAQT